jgi:hypothetical protein
MSQFAASTTSDCCGMLLLYFAASPGLVRIFTGFRDELMRLRTLLNDETVPEPNSLRDAHETLEHQLNKMHVNMFFVGLAALMCLYFLLRAQ